MRKLLLSTALAVSTLVAAAPAAAQWTVTYGTQYGNQYGGPYDNAHGYNGNRGQLRALMVRLNRLERQIDLLDRRNLLSEGEAYRMRFQTERVERQLRVAAANGLNGYAAQGIGQRLARLEQNLHSRVNGGQGYGNRGYGSYANPYDRDRDGRDDRYEDDRGSDNDNY